MKIYGVIIFLLTVPFSIWAQSESIYEHRYDTIGRAILFIDISPMLKPSNSFGLEVSYGEKAKLYSGRIIINDAAPIESKERYPKNSSLGLMALTGWYSAGPLAGVSTQTGLGIFAGNEWGFSVPVELEVNIRYMGITKAHAILGASCKVGYEISNTSRNGLYFGGGVTVLLPMTSKEKDIGY